MKWEEEEKLIWKEAEKKLRKHGYRLVTLEKFKEVFGSFWDLVVDYKKFEDKVDAVAHEAAELEEVFLLTGKWQVPRFTPFSVRWHAHCKANEVADIESKIYERKYGKKRPEELL